LIARPIAAVDNSFGIGIYEKFVPVEPVTMRRIERPIHTICVNLSAPDTFHKDMPVVERLIDVGMKRNDLKWLCIIEAMEQKELYGCSSLRKE